MLEFCLIILVLVIIFGFMLAYLDGKFSKKEPQYYTPLSCEQIGHHTYGKWKREWIGISQSRKCIECGFTQINCLGSY